MKFSIIVACYQSADFIKPCVDSIKSQPGDWECIFRTEKSPDGSQAIARREIGDDSRFTILEGEPSGGPEASRNIGVERAQGEYVLFLDGDDALKAGALAEIEAKLAAERPDVAAFGIDWEGWIRDPWSMIDGTVSGAQAIVAQAAKESFPLAMTQQFVCRTAFLREQKIVFSVGKNHQDEEVLPRLVYPARKFMALHVPLYIYRVREGSMTNSSKARAVGAIASVMKSHFEYFRQVKPEAAVARAWARTWLGMFYFTFFHPQYAAATPKDKMRSALQELFANGMSDFDELLKFASFPRKICGIMVKFATKSGMIGLAKLYFRLYYALCERRKP